MMFTFTAKPGSVHYSFTAPLIESHAVDVRIRRKISLTAAMEDPARITLATGQIFTLAHLPETTPVWVSIFQSDVLDTPSDLVDGSPSFIHVSTKTREDSYGEDHIAICVIIGSEQFGEILRALNSQLKIVFTVSTRLGECESTDEGAPIIITSSAEPGWRREGDSIRWRNDLKRAIAIQSLELNITAPSPESPTADVASEAFSLDGDEKPLRASDLVAATGQTNHALSQVTTVLAAQYRASSLKLSWIVILLVVAIVVFYLRH